MTPKSAHYVQSRQIKRMIASYVGENALFEKMYLTGELGGPGFVTHR